MPPRKSVRVRNITVDTEDTPSIIKTSNGIYPDDEGEDMNDESGSDDAPSPDESQDNSDEEYIDRVEIRHTRVSRRTLRKLTPEIQETQATPTSSKPSFSCCSRRLIITFIFAIIAFSIAIIPKQPSCSSFVCFERNINEMFVNSAFFDASHFLAFVNPNIGRNSLFLYVSYSKNSATKDRMSHHFRNLCGSSLFYVSFDAEKPFAHQHLKNEDVPSISTTKKGRLMECSVIIEYNLNNTKFHSSNRNWIESVVDDSRPVAYLQGGTVPTNDWCVLVFDRLDEHAATALEKSATSQEEIETFLRDHLKYVGEWSDRFIHRLKSLHYIG